MKKYIYLLFLVTLLLSCNNEESLFQEPTRVLAEGELVTIGMSIKLDEIPIASRTMAEEKPATDVNAPLWVAVFDGTGQFVEAAKAFNPIKRVGTNIIDFSLRLHTTSEERRLHFILNYADKMTFEYGNESTVIGSLTTMKNSTSSNEDVYWQRRVLPEGIQILVNENLQPVDPEGTLVDQNDNGIIDGDEKVYTNTGELLEAIPMVRNYAKITVVDNADNFELTGYYVMNVPTSGSVAPYMGEGEFATFGSPTEGIPSQSYKDLLADGYIGFMPDNVGYSNQVASALDNGTATWTSPTTGEGENTIVNPFYMYESTNDGDKSHTVSILLRGKYNEGDETYYKADLVYPNAEQGNLPMYYHVLRNFHYELTINSVSGDGKKTAAEAAAIAAGNNFSGSVDVKNLLNISDGEAALYVWYTDTLFVDSKQFELKYKFINDISYPKNSSNEDVSWFLSGEDGKHIIGEPERALDENGNYYKDEDGWGILKLTPTGTEGVFSETLTLYNSTTQLSREVVLAYRTRYTMDVVCPENVDAAAGKDVIVNIQIPTGLSETMFPLEFVLEAQSLNSTEVLQNCLSPNTTESISVKLGTSIVPGFEGQQSYQFIVTLDYDAYGKLSTTESGNQKVLPVKFKTNIDANASIVYVNNIYFNQGADFFRNPDSKAILYAKWENSHLYGAGQKATLSFIASETGDYTITITEDEAAEGRATSNKTVNLQAGEQYREEITTSTDAGSLSATIVKGTTSVTVVGENRVFPISNAKLSASSSYYGEGQTVLLTFNMTQTGTANITLTGLKDENGNSTIAYVCNRIGEQTITLTSSDASTTEKAEIKYERYTTVVTAQGPTRTRPELKSASLNQTTSAYYGEGHDVDLTFNVSAPCEVTITLNAGLTYNGQSEFTYKCQSAGDQTITLKSADWNTKQKAIVKLTVDGTTTNIEANGATRNKLYLKANSVQYGSYINGTYWYGNDVGNNTSVTITIGSNSAELTCENLKNGSYVEIAEVEEDTITISYNKTSGNSKGNYLQSGIEISDLQSGNFDVRLQKQ